MSFGLYLHIPFCEQHCHYCTFPISLLPASTHEAYIRRLAKELRMAELPGLPTTVYLGGGTPSLVAPHLLADVLAPWTSHAGEVSIEVNPGTIDPARADAYLDLGINRISLGAQSFDPDELRRAGRLHSPEHTVSDFRMLRGRGFANISLDLIAGLPAQGRDAWDANLDWVERLGPDHVSIYLLELEDSAVWARQAVHEQSDQNHAWFYERAAVRLDGMGHRRYETSSWSRPGAECRHNLGYWTGTPYRGVGIGAHSFVGEKRFWNVKTVREYGEMIDRDRLPIAGVEERTPMVRIEEAFLLGLRRVEGFDVRRVANDLRIDYPQDWFERLDRLRDAGLVHFDGRVLRLAPAGWLLATSITEELLCPSLLSICEATR